MSIEEQKKKEKRKKVVNILVRKVIGEVNLLNIQDIPAFFPSLPWHCSDRRGDLRLHA